MFHGEQNVQDVTYLNSEQLGDRIDARRAVFDVYCENDKGEKFIVEMQNVYQEFFKDRTIDGKVFDSSYKRNQPAEMRVNQVIKGFTEALVHMPAGSVWEVYIPQNLAYGEREAGEIKPFSTLIFKIELLKVK
jgi:FKBP-type peptidyl-prolyl cis-trans isomerase (trigger factor)